MTTDNRTNEPSHNRITIRAFRDGEVSIIHEDQVLGLACTLDELKRAVATYEARGALEAAGRPAGTFTEVQVEAAAKAIADCHNPGMFERYPENWRVEARAALVAAQGAAPQKHPTFEEIGEDIARGIRDSLSGVAPQMPNQNETKSGNNFVSLDPEQVADVLRLAMRAEAMMVEDGGYEWIAESDPDDCLPHIARALCEAYTEGKLT